jgi:amino acid transporter
VPYVRNAGAFFAYITKGLGRIPGLAAAYVAILSYVCVAAATSGALGFFAQFTARQFFGLDLPWWLWTLIGLVIIGVLGYFQVTLAARVLGVALVLEAVAVLVLDVGVLVHQGAAAFSPEVFSPSKVFVPSVMGISLMYAFSCFQGFEGTAIYAEEARNPHRTVPRATYAAVLLVAAFFILTSWAMLAGAGMDQAQQSALADPGGFAYSLTSTFVGAAWTDLMQVLIVTSSFAGVLAFHNAISRYFFALSRDGLMPRPLSRVHRRHGSPTAAGATSFTLVAVIVLGFAVAGLDPLVNLATSLTNVGAVGLLALVTLTSLSVLVFFARQRKFGWSRTAAPALATCGLGTATVLSLVNYDVITGTTSAVINNLPWLLVVVIAIAAGVGLWTRARRPERYAAMGSTRVD